MKGLSLGLVLGVALFANPVFSYQLGEDDGAGVETAKTCSSCGYDDPAGDQGQDCPNCKVNRKTETK